MQLILYPYLNDEVKKLYGKEANIDIFDIDFKSISVKSPIDISINLIIKPYTGPHNTISTDKVTVKIGLDNIKIINYIAFDL